MERKKEKYRNIKTEMKKEKYRNITIEKKKNIEILLQK